MNAGESSSIIMFLRHKDHALQYHTEQEIECKRSVLIMPYGCVTLYIGWPADHLCLIGVKSTTIGDGLVAGERQPACLK